MKRNLILAALSILAANVLGGFLTSSVRADPLPQVPIPPAIAAVDGQDKKEVTPMPTPPGAQPGTIKPAPTGEVITGGTACWSDTCHGGCKKLCGFSVGAGFYLLRPHWDSAPALEITTSVGGTQDTTFINLNHDSSVAPKAWASYTGDDGFAVRGSWWRLDSTLAFTAQQLPTQTIAIPNNNLGNLSLGALAVGQFRDIIADSRLLMDVWDIDFTQTCQHGCWTLTGGFGLRYTRLAQSFNAYVNRVGLAAGFETSSFHSANVFEGLGPQGLIEARKTLCSDWGLGVFASARGGILFGENRLASQAFTRSNDGVIETVTINRRGNVNDDSLPFVELEAGVEWAKDCGWVTPFLRASVVGQHWFGAGSPTSLAGSKTGDLGLFGLHVVGGFHF